MQPYFICVSKFLLLLDWCYVDFVFMPHQHSMVLKKMKKISSQFIAKKAPIILILLFCTLGSIVVFILIYQLIIAMQGGPILSLFLSENDSQASSPSDEIIEHFQWFDQKACQNTVFFGEYEGQKVVCLDEQFAPKINNCIVYSFGIHDDWSFEEKMEELRGCHVYSFDHLMDKGYHDHSKKIHFYPMVLGSKDKPETSESYLETMTLSSIYEMLSMLYGETDIDYLKISNVEDFDVLTQIIDSAEILKRVRQLSLKIIVPSEMEENQGYLKKIFEVLQRIGDDEVEMVRFSSRVDYFSNRKLHGKLTPYSVYELAWFNPGKVDDGGIAQHPNHKYLQDLVA